MDTETLIIGGGLAGLALADHLSTRGQDFLLAEAQDRLGGRILTLSLHGAEFDLGPAWFWPGQTLMEALTKRFQIPVFEQYSKGAVLFQERSGTVHVGRGFASMQGSLRLAGGMGALVKALTSQLDPKRLLTGRPLVRLEHGPQGVTAHFGPDATGLVVTARRVVLAIPPRVIAKDVTFSPPLSPEQMQALRSTPTWMAGQAKVVAVYDRPYWREVGFSGDASSQHGPMVEIHDASPISGGPFGLFGFLGISAQIRATHHAEIPKAALAQLTSLFGPDMANPLDLVVQDWARVPQTTCPADHHAAGYHPDSGLPRSLAQLSHTGIYFGSTETAPDSGGLLEGALQAARALARRLEPATPDHASPA